MRFAALIPLGAVAALAACGTGPKLPITQPVVNLVSPQAEAADDFHRPDLIEVRSILREGINWREIGPADCTARANGQEANFETPALIQVPVFFGKTRSVLIQCRMAVGGIARVTGTTVDAVNLSRPDNEGVTISVGSEGASVGAVVSLRNRDKDRFDFPAKVTVTFAP